MLMTPRAASIDLIQRYFRAFNAGDRPAFFALLAEDVVHDLNQGGTETGLSAFRTFMERMDRCYAEQIGDLVIMADESGTRAAARSAPARSRSGTPGVFTIRSIMSANRRRWRGSHRSGCGTLDGTLAQLRELTAGSHVTLLDDGAAVLDGVRFLGTTLWTDFQLDADAAKRQLAIEQALLHMRDFQRIHVDPASVSIVRYTESRPFVIGTNTHAGDLAWLTPPRRKARGRRRTDAEVGGGAGPQTGTP